MTMIRKILPLSLLAAVITPAAAHMSISSGEAKAGWYYTASIDVPHGCKDPASTKEQKLKNWDTYKVEINVPKSFKRPRPYDNIFGKATVTDTDFGYLLTWTRHSDYAEYPTDSNAYTMSFKTKLPKGDFATHYFPSTQYCRKDGVETKTVWDKKFRAKHNKPAPKVIAYPKNRHAGWNNFTIEQPINNMSVFNNAQIVWFEQSAYSKNPATRTMIENDTAVAELNSIPAGASIWVKY